MVTFWFPAEARAGVLPATYVENNSDLLSYLDPRSPSTAERGALARKSSTNRPMGTSAAPSCRVGSPGGRTASNTRHSQRRSKRNRRRKLPPRGSQGPGTVGLTGRSIWPVCVVAAIAYLLSGALELAVAYGV